MIQEFEAYLEGAMDWRSVEVAYWAALFRAAEIRRARNIEEGRIEFVSWRDSRDHFGDPNSLAKSMAELAETERSKDIQPEQRAQCNILRDIFGNPFRPVTLDAAWLAWNNGTVVKLAQAIYDERAFDHLPILADALEDAGCHHEDILTHCRGTGPHVRGCWVVDLLLEKQ